MIDTLDPAKDIDGIHPLNAGLLALGYEGFLPATAHAAVEILKRSGIELEGERAVVVGRSNVVGKPAALLLLREHATVTVCHSQDARPRRRTCATPTSWSSRPAGPASSPATCSSPAPWSSTSASTSSTAGSSATSTSSPRAASPRRSRPCPGGVGPVTNALLLTHLVRAARDQAEAGAPRPRRPPRVHRQRAG